jgi:hypothetical protein
VFLLLKSPEHVGLDPDSVARRHAYDFRISSNRSPKLIRNCIEFVYALSRKSISELFLDIYIWGARSPTSVAAVR